MFRGVSGFSIMSKAFPYERFLEQFPESLERPFLPVLYGFFGRDFTGINAFIDKFHDREMLIEFHLSFRSSKLLDYYKRAAKNIDVNLWQHKRASNVRLVICPVLEDDVLEAKLDLIKKTVLSNLTFPHVYCRNPLSSFVRVKDKFEERHGISPAFKLPPKRRIYNPDGVSVDFNDGEKYFKKMSVDEYKSHLSIYKPYAACTWSASQQGLQGVTTSNTAPPPKQRKFMVTDEAIDINRELLK